MEFHDRGSLCQLLDAIEDEPRLYLRIERGVGSSDNIVIIRWANAPGSPIKVIRRAKRLHHREGAAFQTERHELPAWRDDLSVCRAVVTPSHFRMSLPRRLGHQLPDRDMRERFDALPGTFEVEVAGHWSRCDNAADASGEGSAETVEGVFEDDGLLGFHAEFFGSMQKERRIGLHLAGVIDGGDVVEVIVEAELVHPRINPRARAAGGDGDTQAQGIGLLQKIGDARKKA